MSSTDVENNRQMNRIYNLELVNVNNPNMYKDILEEENNANK